MLTFKGYKAFEERAAGRVWPPIRRGDVIQVGPASYIYDGPEDNGKATVYRLRYKHGSSPYNARGILQGKEWELQPAEKASS